MFIRRPRVPIPPRFEWHQDGGRQNREIETTPRPRLSVKLAYWLSDISGPGRGNLKIVPGSHLVNWIDGPPRRDREWPDPPGAIEVTAEPGDVLFFDRRIWPSRSRNYSAHTRKAVFFGYTYRWAAVRDDLAAMRSAGWFSSTPPAHRSSPEARGCPVRGDCAHQSGQFLARGSLSRYGRETARPGRGPRCARHSEYRPYWPSAAGGESHTPQGRSEVCP
jgi:Phytanoyl-CoA dioxygenase (PhyH)